MILLVLIRGRFPELTMILAGGFLLAFIVGFFLEKRGNR